MTTEVLTGLCQRPPHTPDPPGPTGIRRDNPRVQGEIGLGDAIGWFSRRGLTVSIPLADNQPYDLITDVDGDLARVQVKTATGQSRYGRYLASLETAGGNQSFHTRKPFDAVRPGLCADGCRGPSSPCIRARRTISLGDKWQPFRAPVPESAPSLPRDQP